MAYLSQKELELIGFAKVGEQVFISDKVSIYNASKISIGSFISEFDELNKLHEGMSDVISKPVVFETNSGIGEHSLVLPGVIIGMGSGIGAMSVVYEDVNPWGIFIGNPVRFVKKRSDHVYKELFKLRK